MTIEKYIEEFVAKFAINIVDVKTTKHLATTWLRITLTAVDAEAEARGFARGQLAEAEQIREEARRECLEEVRVWAKSGSTFHNAFIPCVAYSDLLNHLDSLTK